ncbi:hypothetical protein M0R19_04700 [Candidatus Pacearchaeota archaeon]|nr:hypothetical protein [Candidatus Pacearchaeota archaeon]
MASTAIFSQQCFITGTQKRIVDARGEVWQTGFSVMLLPNINTIGIDFLVSNGVNKYGVTLIDSGRVVSVEKIDHPRRGLQFFDVWVIKGE